MMASVPIGAVCPFAGQVVPNELSPSSIWGESGCESSQPAPVTKNDKPVTNIEVLGWMLCDGRWLNVFCYPELFSTLGYLYGRDVDASGQSTFRIPDYRGVFLRGFDAGAGMDPDAASRLDPVGGARQVNTVGSRQCDAIQRHTHSYQITNPAAVSQTGAAAGTNAQTKESGDPDASARSSTETRARNIAVNFIIRYR